MARKTTKLTRDAYLHARDRNYEGFPTFYRSLEEQTLQVLTTGTFGNTFYVEPCGFPATTLVQQALEKRIKVDTFIGITDNEDWCYGYVWDGKSMPQRGDEYGFLNAWRRYKRTVNKDAKAFLLTIAPYRHAVAPQPEPDVWFVYGWSHAVLPFIARTLQGAETQGAAVRAVNLDKPASEAVVSEDLQESVSATPPAHSALGTRHSALQEVDGGA